MPHWAEIRLPEPVDVAKIELVSRPGPYLVADIDVEAHAAGSWKLLKSIRNATSRVISGPLDAPVRTDRIRVTILRELFEGKDRQYADVEAIRVLDTAGRDCSTNRAQPVAVTATAPDLRRAIGQEPLSFLPMAVRVKPTGAEVIAELDNADRSPAVLLNRFGRGQAILVTTSEGSFQENGPFWAALRRLVVGEPTLACDEKAMDRYRFILTRAADAHVLHVIDSTAGAADYQPADVALSLEAERFGAFQRAELVGSAAPLAIQTGDGRITFTLRPDPVASVVLH
ncbi:MAG: hypothetical protein HQ582_13050 [Planctomycetes bacterium]|nr:hypothetical protein [Planctomycetota bacterium]